VQDAKVDIGGRHLSHDQWRVADIAVTYTQNGFLAGNSSASLDVAQGLPVAGATSNGSDELSRPGARTDFTKLVGTLRRTQLLYGPVSLSLAAQGQYSFAPLIVGEQIAFGGHQIGRGYEPSAITGDHGAGGSAELRYDWRFEQAFIQLVQPYLFIDAARIWDRGGAAPKSDIASTGAGLRAFFAHELSGGVELARTLRPVPGSDNGERATKILVNGAARF
jgi:hemolysin activation/secretion protein